MVLFEIHHRFKGHFLNKLRISFKQTISLTEVFHFKTLRLGFLFFVTR